MGPIRRVQLHLVTLLALSFTASGLLWLNVRCSPGYPYIADYDISGDRYDPILKYSPSLGWPKAFLRPDVQTFFFDIGNNVSLAWGIPTGPNMQHHVMPALLAIDLAVSLVILGFVGFLSEWTLRRRSARPAVQIREPEASASLT